MYVVNMSAPMVKWLGEVLVYKPAFIITDEYGEAGQVPANNFMIVMSILNKRLDSPNSVKKKATPCTVVCRDGLSAEKPPHSRISMLN